MVEFVGGAGGGVFCLILSYSYRPIPSHAGVEGICPGVS